MRIDLLPAAVCRWLFKKDAFTAGMTTFFLQTAHTLLLKNAGSRFGVFCYRLFGLRCPVSELFFY